MPSHTCSEPWIAYFLSLTPHRHNKTVFIADQRLMAFLVSPCDEEQLIRANPRINSKLKAITSNRTWIFAVWRSDAASFERCSHVLEYSLLNYASGLWKGPESTTKTFHNDMHHTFELKGWEEEENYVYAESLQGGWWMDDTFFRSSFSASFFFLLPFQSFISPSWAVCAREEKEKPKRASEQVSESVCGESQLKQRF